MEKVKAVNASDGWSVTSNVNKRQVPLRIAILVLFLLGLTATPALASTGQEINLLPTLDALNLHEETEISSLNWGDLSWTGSANNRKGKETKTGWKPRAGLPGGAYLKLAPYSDTGGDAAALTMQVSPGISACFLALWLDMPSPNSEKSGYQLSWAVNGGTGGTNFTVKLSKWSSGTETVIASNPSVSIAVGTTMAISDTGSTVSVWQGTGGSLTSILSASDTTYQSGYAGIEGQGENSRAINFKAGPLMGAAVGASAVLDNLERNETPLAASSWSKSNWAENIGSARMGSYRGYGASTGLAGSYWGQENFKGTWGGTLVAGTVGTGSTPEGQYFALWLNMPTPSSTRSGYEARFTGGGSASNYKVELSKWSAGTRTVLASTTGFSLPTGTTMALTKSGSSLVLWTGTSTLAPVLSASDATYVTGYAGLEASGSAGTIYNFKAARIGLPAIDTSIIGGLGGTVIPPISFSFTGPLGTTGFECALDGEAYAACTSPKSYPGISEGSHTFHVRAIGVQGVDATPAERTIQVAKLEKLATKVPLLDNLERSEVPLATGKWSKTSWAEQIGGTWMGSYRGYGSTGGLAGASWTQGESFTDFYGTIVASGVVGTGATPEGQYLALWLDMSTTTRNGYEARFTGGGSASNYKVEISKWLSGTRTVLASTTGFSLPVGTTMAFTETPGGTLALYTGTSTMSQVLSASDSAYSSGRTGLEVNGGAGTIYNFRAGGIDLQAPNTTITKGPPEIGPPEKASLTFTSTEESTFECSLDVGAYEACSSPKAYPTLGDGKHTVRVRAVDRVGNQDETPAESTFWIYKQPTVVTQSISNVNSSQATLLGTVTPNGLSTTYQFEYGTTTAYGSKAPIAPENAGFGTKQVFVSKTISGLQADTVYHYRLAATSSGGTAYGEDRTFTVDRAVPAMTFTSSYNAGSPIEYTLNIHATDSGSHATGVQRVDVLLNGEVSSSFGQSCPIKQCPQVVDVTWKHSFSHPLNGQDHLTVIALDQANNSFTSGFDLPSQVVSATVNTGNPAQGGKQLAEEWTQLYTHNSRLQEPTTTTTRGTTTCPSPASAEWCSVLRTSASGEPFSEASTPVGDPAEISEAGTLALPSQPDFGKVKASGAMSEIAQTWQVLPPGAGTTYEKVVSENKADAPAGQAAQVSGEWTFWIDATTKLPVKASRKEGSESPQMTYYSYAPSKLEVGNLAPDFFLLNRPTRQAEGCIESGQLGGWTYSPAGFTYPDPRFNSVVNTSTGLVLLRPEGAATDGYEPRAMLTKDGVEVTTGTSDVGQLSWEVVESPDQTLESAGPDVVVVSEAGVPSAIIQPSSTSAVKVVDGEPDPNANESGDEVVLEPMPAGTSADIQSVEPEQASTPCITNAMAEQAAVVHEEAVAAGVVRPMPASSGSQTTTVDVWINPHPALKGVQVTDKYAACNGPSTKTFGEDGHVVFGGCPVGSSVTFTVPHEVAAGGTNYAVSDSSRTIKPPNTGWTIDFNYDPQAQPPESGPPPGGEVAPRELRFGSGEVEADGPGAEISSEEPIDIPPPYDCFLLQTRPWRSDVAFPNQVVARSRSTFRCNAGTFIDSWWAKWHLSRWVEESGEWSQRSEKEPRGRGPATTNQGPFFINAECRALDNLLSEPEKRWRSEAKVFGLGEYPNGTLYGIEPKFYATDGKVLHCG